MMRRWLGVLILASSCGGSQEATTTTDPLPVQTFEEMGREHFTVEETQAMLAGAPNPITYNSDPATSGKHAPIAAPCGIYRQEIPDYFTIHTMEHGGVIVWYRPDLPLEQVEGLEALARELQSRILVTPRADLETPMVLGAWTTLLFADAADVELVRSFWTEYAGHGPEQIGCPFAVDEAAG